MTENTSLSNVNRLDHNKILLVIGNHDHARPQPTHPVTQHDIEMAAHFEESREGRTGEILSRITFAPRRLRKTMRLAFEFSTTARR